MYNASLKLDYQTDFGTFTAITAYDDLKELLTGDNFNFVPPQESLINFFPIGQIIRSLTGDGFADLSQTQYLETDSWSQEIRFTSPSENRLRWIVGAYGITTYRYISTGNQVDRATACSTSRRRRAFRCSSTPRTPALSSVCWWILRTTWPGPCSVRWPMTSPRERSWPSRCATTRTTARTPR